MARLSERTSLSGTPPAPRAVQPAKVELRRCANCGVADQVEAIEGEYDSLGRPKVEHLVTVQLRYLKGVQSESEVRRKITRSQGEHGWTYKFFQGKHAIERFVCRTCLRELDLMERDWARKGEKQESTLGEFYGVLCGE